MKEGSSVFAPVGKSFSGPPWRQALIVQKLDSERWLLVVRVEGPTTDQEGSFELEGRTFMVVEGSTPSMRKACQDPFLALEVQTASLQAAASEFLSSHHDLVFTPASEEAGPLTRTVGSSKVESDSDSSEGEVDLLEDLKRMQKSWQGRGTNDDDSSSDAKVAAKLTKKEKHKKQKKKYAHLESKDQWASRKTADEEDSLLQKLAGGSSADTLQTLAALGVFKQLRGRSRRKSKDSSSSSSSRQRTASSSSGSHRGHKATGVAKAVGNFRRWKRSLKKHPVKHVRRYVKQVELGARLGGDRWPAIPADRPWPKDNLESTEVTSASLLLARGDPGEATPRAARASRFAHRAVFASHPSGGDRRRQLVPSMAANRTGRSIRSTQVRGGGRISGNHSSLPQSFSGLGEANQNLEPERGQCRDRAAGPSARQCRRRLQGPPSERRPWQRKEFRPCESGRLKPQAKQAEGDIHNLVDLLNKHHGSFARFLQMLFFLL